MGMGEARHGVGDAACTCRHGPVTLLITLLRLLRWRLLLLLVCRRRRPVLILLRRRRLLLLLLKTGLSVARLEAHALLRLKAPLLRLEAALLWLALIPACSEHARE